MRLPSRIITFELPRLWGLALVFCLVLLASSRAAEGEWKEGALLFYSESSLEMNRLRAQGQNDRRLLAYLDAVEMMHLKTSDTDSIESSRAIFRTLVEGGLDDDVGVAAAYYDIRITQLFQPVPDLEQAAHDFRYLYSARPNHFFGQLALLKSLLIDLAAPSDADSVLPRLARLEGQEEQLTIPDFRRSFHKAMGERYRRDTGLKRKAFAHLKAAYAIGFSVESIQADLCFDLAQIAEEIGETEYAVERYDEFVKKHADDSRAIEVRSHLKALQGI